MEPGELLARGRAADVYDQGDGTVLRRYRTDHDVTAEARTMRWLAEQGYPVPVVRHAAGPDLVMDRIVGPTMLDDLARRPWRLVTHARLLARLQRRLNGMDAPGWLAARQGVPAGDAVLHLDLHPMNVMLPPGGPVVIDWTNTSRGPAAFDAAMSSVLMSTADLGSALERGGVAAFVSVFERTRGREELRGFVPGAASYRLGDPNVTARERARLRRLADA